MRLVKPHISMTIRIGTFAALMAGLPLAADTSIVYPGAIMTMVTAINSAGTLVGWHDTNQAFMRDSGGVFHDVAYPGQAQNVASSINSGGVICGYYFDGSFNEQGWIDNAGSFTLVQYPGATSTWPTVIDNSGNVWGNFFPADGMGRTAFKRTSGGTYTAISGPSAGVLIAPLGVDSTTGTISGYAYNTSLQPGDCNSEQGFLLSGSTYTWPVMYPGSCLTVLIGTDSNGVVYGYFRASDGHFHGLTYNAGTFTSVDHCNSQNENVVVEIKGSNGSGTTAYTCNITSSFTSP